VQLLKDPEYLFGTPEFRKYGNLFWGDIYSEGLVKVEAYDYVGAPGRRRRRAAAAGRLRRGAAGAVCWGGCRGLGGGGNNAVTRGNGGLDMDPGWLAACWVACFGGALQRLCCTVLRG
jgi:hypothetical protein